MISPDLLLSVANVGVAAVVLPTVWHGFKRRVSSIPLGTSLGRVFFLSLMGVGFALAGLVVATIMILFNISIWAVLALQNKMYHRKTWNHDEAMAEYKRGVLDGKRNNC